MEFKEIYYRTGNSPFNAVNNLPALGLPHNKLKGMFCNSYKISPVPRGFFDWLFRRPKLWQVTVSFIPVEDVPYIVEN